MGESERTEIGSSFSEKQDQAVMHTEVIDNGVARESGAERRVPEEQMREGKRTELGNSFSEKQNQAVVRTEGHCTRGLVSSDMSRKRRTGRLRTATAVF